MLGSKKLSIVGVIAASCIAFEGAFARETYLAKIPNSDKVKGVAAIGHTNGEGGGELTPFGTAFGEAKEWSKELCEADSDGDGQSNGVELGDPCCVWSYTGEVAYETVSHPGDPESMVDKSALNFVCGDSLGEGSGSVSASSSSDDASIGNINSTNSTKDGSSAAVGVHSGVSLSAVGLAVVLTFGAAALRD